MPERSHHIRDFGEFIDLLDRIAAGGISPTSELMHAYLAALRANATERDRRRYDALRQTFEQKRISAPDGKKYSLKTLQRWYVRFVLVERYRQVGETWEGAYERASAYISAGKAVSADTVRDSHAKIKKVLKVPGMRRFLGGLDYEFMIALYGDEAPLVGTVVEPDFLRGAD